MKFSKHIITLVSAACLQFSGQPALAADAPTPGELFQKVEDRFTTVQSLSYTVKRSTSSKKQVAEDKWSFRFKSPDKVRIDYLEPYSRVIVADTTNLVEYLPTARKAMKTDLAAIPSVKRELTLNGVFKRLSVDGLRLGNYQEMLKRAVKVTDVRMGGKNAWLVEGANPRYLVFIDPDKWVLLKTEIYAANGELVLRTESSAFVEAFPGFWLPREIHANSHASEGYYQTTVKLSDIRVNDLMADQIFRFDLPAGVEVITSK